ncbi:hypothetical protein OS493_019508 [Desmophyllum pertusum]|uniref:Uncharacterized protein n=1 Tax=Desmophyllum pertusum TaxID=174260 RepID=A0A9W9ZNH7_9CNID|nr:hypothetical protein OS493_019508 [Desmophyllum pertusum]
MKHFVILMTLIGGFLTPSRYAAAQDCEVSLPQKSTFLCNKDRKKALAQNQKIYTLKHDEASYGFALLNMTAKELTKVLLKDPFTRSYTTAWLGMTATNQIILKKYNKLFEGEIKRIREYGLMKTFFQSASGANTRGKSEATIQTRAVY